MLEQELEAKVEKAEEINVEVKKSILKLVESSKSKGFKKVYKSFHKLKNVPARVVEDVNKATPELVQAKETVMSDFCVSKERWKLTREYALLAIVQSSCRPLKTGEDRAALLKVAEECDAVVECENPSSDPCMKIPPRFGLLLSGAC